MLPSSIRVNPHAAAVRGRGGYGHVVSTGSIDAYFDYRYDSLPYRSPRFEHKHLPDTQRYQETGSVNYPNAHASTWITEVNHLTSQQHAGTSIVREYPQAEGDLYYPVLREENETLFKR